MAILSIDNETEFILLHGGRGKTMDLEQVKTPETKKAYVKPAVEFISLNDTEMAMFRKAAAMHENLSEDQILAIKELLNHKRQS